MDVSVPVKKIYQVLGRCPEGVNKVAAALSRAKLNYLPLVRNKCSHFAKKNQKGEREPDYADLAQCHRASETALANEELSVVQLMSHDTDGTLQLITQLIHGSGQWIESTVPLAAGAKDPQRLSAAVTYARRMAYCALVGLAADDDDDGEQAQTGALLHNKNSEEKYFNLLSDKMKAQTTMASREAVVHQAERGLQKGDLTQRSVEALKGLMEKLNAEAKPEPKKKKQAQPA